MFCSIGVRLADHPEYPPHCVAAHFEHRDYNAFSALGCEAWQICKPSSPTIENVCSGFPFKDNLAIMNSAEGFIRNRQTQHRHTTLPIRHHAVRPWNLILCVSVAVNIYLPPNTSFTACLNAVNLRNHALLQKEWCAS